MRSRTRSLSDYLAEAMPEELRWSRRPHGYEENREFNRLRYEWCQAHRIDPLQLIRHDRDQKRAAMGLPPKPQPTRARNQIPLNLK